MNLQKTIEKESGKWTRLHSNGAYFNRCIPGTPQSQEANEKAYFEDIKASYYQDSYKHLYMKNGYLDGPGQDGSFCPAIVDMSNDVVDKTILEIGCGYGGFGAGLASLAKSYIGIDISKELIDLGNKVIKQNSITNMSLHYCPDNNVLDIVEKHSIDLVLTASVFIHTPVIVTKNYLMQHKDFLKPTGKFMHKFEMSNTDRSFHVDPDHESGGHLFTDPELKELFEGTSLKITSSKYTQSLPHCKPLFVYGGIENN